MKKHRRGEARSAFAQVRTGRHGVVLLDLNGTLIDEEHATITVATQRLIAAVRAIEHAGWAVGLCSDSPYGPLKDWGMRHGIKPGAIFGENGLVVNRVALKRWNTSPVQELVRQWAKTHGVQVLSSEALAREFGGYRPPIAGIAFGAGRSCSLSIFCYRADGGRDAAVAAALGEHLRQHYGEAVDVAPDVGFIAVHQAQDFRLVKSQQLLSLGARLKDEGKRLVMIGNSGSDLIGNPTFGETWLVADATFEAKERADRVLTKPCTEGVVEGLELLSGTPAKTD